MMAVATNGSSIKYNKAELQRVFHNAVYTALVEAGDDCRNIEWISSLPYIHEIRAEKQKAA